MNKHIFILLFALSLLIFTGCGGEKGCTLTGSISWKGKPVEKGMIDFEPVDGIGASVSGEVLDGKYTAIVPLGKKKVRVYAFVSSGERPAYQGDPNSPKIKLEKQIIPEKFNAKTTLECDVQGKEQVYDFMQ